MAEFRCVRCRAEIDRAFKACPHCGEPVTEFLRRYFDEPIDGKYRIVERLGAGGMGEVYKVEHAFLRSTRVIKVIRPQISDSEDAHERFLREAQLATKVQHPNVATLHDFSALPDGSHYMVWEYIEGENLAQVLRRRGPLAPREAIRLAIEALGGLEAIHRAGIIHRDISPENLMITRDSAGIGHAKIIDLGVAKAEDGDYAVTRTGIFVGKLRYASPEQLGFLPDGEKLDGRADLYSMAIVLYEMLTGRPPFESTSPHEYIMRHSGERTVAPLDLSGVPGGPELRAVLERALERDRSKRFASAAEFATELQKVEAKAAMVADDATLRLTPPSGTTLRAPLAQTQAAAATVRTGATPPPLAPAAPAATTVRTDVAQTPSAPTPAATPASRSSAALVVFIVLLVLIIGAAGIVASWLWLHRKPPTPATAVAAKTAASLPATTQAPPPVPAPAQPATATVEVAPPTPAPQPVPEPEPEPRPQPAPAEAKPKPAVTATAAPTQKQKAPPAASAAQPESSSAGSEQAPSSESESVQTYVEGGMGSRNDAAVAFAHGRLRGVTRVSLDARGDDDLVKQLPELLKGLNLTVADTADVHIRFYGTVTHLHFGRKQRAAEATILKNGQPVFRYQLKPEEYRVGDNPAEAFARVLSDVFSR